MTAVAQRPVATKAPPPPPPPPAPHSHAVVAEAALVGLTLAAVVGLSRLFTHPLRFFLPVAFVGLTVHAIALACRRFHLELAPTAAIAVLGVAIATTWSILGSTTVYGLPWTGTAHAARIALDNAATVYRASAAPVDVIPGFTLAGAIGVAVSAFLADWAGFRMRATTEACLPSFSLFVLSAALAQGHGVVIAGAVWLVALLVFLLARQPAVESPSTAWFASESRRGPRTILLTGGALAAGATAAVVLIGPVLPGATIHPVFNWRNRGGGNRTIGTSPLVDITARLKSQSHQEVFTVSASRPSYWRLTSLDTFTGSGWALDNEYVGAAGRLPPSTQGAADTGPTTPVQADFHLGPISSIWLPAPYRPERIAGVNGVSFSADSGSIITNGKSSDNLTYAVESAVPAATPQLLAAAPPIDPSDPTMARYLQLPGSVPPVVRAIAERVTAGAPTPYAKALALQNWLRSPPFRYDLNVPPDGSPNALLNFLTVTQAGFCQQFAASYGVLARSIGLPTRVAVGFTEGNVTEDGLYHVTDAEAHAWPEVYFSGVGWIAFEPTPGRGSPDPSAQAVTGVPPAQQTEPAPVTVPSVATPTTAAGAPATTPRRQLTTPTATPPAAQAHHHAHWWIPLAWVIGLPLAWVGLLAGAGAVIRARRRAAATTPGGVVALAWADVRDDLAAAGAPPLRSETPAEYSHRASRVTVLPVEARDALARVARAVEVADYSPGGPTTTLAQDAAAAAHRVRTSLRENLSGRDRFVRLWDPRPVGALLFSRRA